MSEKVIYQHRFDNIESYLHHRSPWLMVNQIVSIESDSVVTEHLVKESAAYIEGHFPGAPIMPGSVMQEFSTQSAGILIAANFNPMEKYDTHDPYFNEYALGVLVKIKRARYRGFGRPGETIRASVTLDQQIGDLFDFSCRLTIDDRKIMENQFQLTNMLSSKLRGE